MLVLSVVVFLVFGLLNCLGLFNSFFYGLELATFATFSGFRSLFKAH